MKTAYDKSLTVVYILIKATTGTNYSRLECMAGTNFSDYALRMLCFFASIV